MVVSNQWKLLVAAGALTFVVSACGEDDPAGLTTKDGGTSNGDAGPSIVPLPANTAGNACTKDTECGSSGKCATALTGGNASQLLTSAAGVNFASAAEGGYCTLDCNTDVDCGEGGVCFGSGAGLPPIGGEINLTGECRTKCMADADCRGGYECAGPSAGLTTLLSGIPFLGPMLIPPSSCQAVPTADSLTDGVGKACKADTDCGGGYCDPESTSMPAAPFPGFEAPSYPGGYCTGVCTKNSDCGAKATCLAGFYGSAGTCRATCTTDTDCARKAEGYICQNALTDANVKVCRYKAPDADAGTPAGDAGTADAGTADAGA